MAAMVGFRPNVADIIGPLDNFSKGRKFGAMTGHVHSHAILVKHKMVWARSVMHLQLWPTYGSWELRWLETLHVMVHINCWRWKWQQAEVQQS